MTVPEQVRDGIVLAATGRRYRALAYRAGRTIRRVMPEVALDLFTDAPEGDPGPFDKIHDLAETGHRPKFEALRRSRFDRTLLLDVDIVMVAGVAPVFDLFERYDILGVHEQFGIAPITRLGPSGASSPALRQINGGVLGVVRNDRTRAFVDHYEGTFQALGGRFDQPALMEALAESPVRLCVLPLEYNLMHLPYMRFAVPGKMLAPRLLHLPGLHKGDAPVDASQPFDLGELLNPHQLEALDKLLAQDPTLGARLPLSHKAVDTIRRVPWLERKVRRLRDWLT